MSLGMKYVVPLPPKPAHIGVAFNVQDGDNYDFIYFRFHSSTFEIGTIVKGGLTWKTTRFPPVKGNTKFYNALFPRLASKTWHKVQLLSLKTFNRL